MHATILPGPGAKNARGGDRHSIQSVDRALLLLETIADAGGEATLTDLASRTGLNISTCHHLLATLIQRGFATKVPGRLYALGARIIYLGHACLQVDLPRRAQPYLEAINQATGETVHLAALQGDNIVTLSVREARHAVRVDTGRIGKMEAPHATSVGKAILAWLPEEEIKRILAGGMKRFTDRTITDLPTLLESLRLVRRNGYAIDREEFLPGVLCVGAAIRDQAGTVIGAISASTPTMRANDEHIALMRQEITTAARGLSAEFGEPGSQSNGRPQAVAN
ncbi:MAG TPA: IclR family transcriptional regulator [Pseudolabrys sp.]|jgi:IclR family acetate operon transcriptional repressor|nr:IclR family transcriptional regulator [Pseudolabrys sp.]